MTPDDIVSSQINLSEMSIPLVLGYIQGLLMAGVLVPSSFKNSGPDTFSKQYAAGLIRAKRDVHNGVISIDDIDLAKYVWMLISHGAFDLHEKTKV